MQSVQRARYICRGNSFVPAACCPGCPPILHGATPEFQVGWQTRRSPSVALARPFVAFFNGFNRGFERLAPFYGQMTARLIRLTAVVLAEIGKASCRERVCQYV